MKETAKVGDDAFRRLARGVEDLDFYIGDEAMDSKGYAVRVSFALGVVLKFHFLLHLIVQHKKLVMWNNHGEFLLEKKRGSSICTKDHIMTNQS